MTAALILLLKVVMFPDSTGWLHSPSAPPWSRTLQQLPVAVHVHT